MNTVRHTTMTVLIAATAITTVIASPAFARVHSHAAAQGAEGAYASTDPSQAYAAVGAVYRPLPDSNPDWRVYNYNDRYIGSDPDPRIRMQMLEDSIPHSH
jgi:hypothetical protein